MAWTLVVLPVLECRSPGTSREVQNSNDGNITKQRGEASEPTNHPPDTAAVLGADWVRCYVRQLFRVHAKTFEC